MNNKKGKRGNKYNIKNNNKRSNEDVNESGNNKFILS